MRFKDGKIQVQAGRTLLEGDLKGTWGLELRILPQLAHLEVKDGKMYQFMDEVEDEAKHLAAS